MSTSPQRFRSMDDARRVSPIDHPQKPLHLLLNLAGHRVPQPKLSELLEKLLACVHSEIECENASLVLLNPENASAPVCLKQDLVSAATTFDDIIGSSQALGLTLAHVAKAAPTDCTVLITGETGTGKELIARAIHKRSRRSTRPFVRVNCAAIPPSLIASELFGHEKGAFTGATERRLGRFELAHHGTIFLDEIGDIPAETQVALLRVLQEREFERVGGSRVIPVDVRVLAATNQDLETAVAAGTFRLDLFYRLNVFPIAIPPLRARIDDIPLLASYFADHYAAIAGKKVCNIPNFVFDLLRSYHWPGNIRELQNVIERAVILSDGELLSVDESWIQNASPGSAAASGSLTGAMANNEKEIIEAALEECRGRISGPSGAASKLGIPRSTLESKIRSLHINKHRFRAEAEQAETTHSVRPFKRDDDRCGSPNHHRQVRR